MTRNVLLPLFLAWISSEIFLSFYPEFVLSNLCKIECFLASTDVLALLPSHFPSIIGGILGLDLILTSDPSWRWVG